MGTNTAVHLMNMNNAVMLMHSSSDGGGEISVAGLIISIILGLFIGWLICKWIDKQ